MHGMLSAAIVVGVFALAAAACLFLAVRVFAANLRDLFDALSEHSRQNLLNFLRSR